MAEEVSATIAVLKACDKLWVEYRSGTFSAKKRRRQFQQTKRMLEVMQAFKQNSSNKGFEEGSPEYLEFLKIGEATHDLENLVFEVLWLEEACGQPGGLARKLFHKLVLSRMEHSGVRSQMQDISTTLSEIKLLEGAPKSATSNVEHASSSDSSRRSETIQTSPPRTDHPIVGFEENTENLVAHLMREGNTNRVACIRGEGGTGKSILAGEIYKHGRVKSHFEAFAWVSMPEKFEVKDVLKHILFSLVGEKFEVKDVLKHILFSLVGENVDDLNPEEVEEKLKVVLKEKKCLVVLDKIGSNATILDVLKRVFPKDDSKSILLLTTRKKKVALHVDEDCFLFKPSYLGLDNSLELIKACLRRNGRDEESICKSEALLREKLKECAGLPAAIIKLGQLLSGNEGTLESKLKDLPCVKHCLLEGKIHDLDETKHTGLFELFNRSYSELSSNLGRSCFQLLACIFPENFEIKVTELCQLLMVALREEWMRKYGKNRNSTDFDEGWVYRLLEDLEQNSMVSVVKYSSTGRMKTIRVSGLMRYFGIFMAQKDNFVQVLSAISNVEEAIGSSASGRVAKQRRLCTAVEMDSNQWGSLVKDTTYHSLSSLFCSKSLPAGSVSKKLLKKFRNLRVLILENQNSYVKLPGSLGNLHNLKFFSLKDSNVEKVPPSIGEQKFLETLDLRTQCQLLLPNGLFRKLKLLRHLYLPESGHGKKLRFEGLNCLRKLVNIPLEDCDLNVLVKLCLLEKLVCVRTRTEPIIIPETSSRFEHLKSLTVENSYGEDVDIRPILLSCWDSLEKLRLKGIKKLPQLSPNLKKLTLRNAFLRDDPMDVLGKQQKLQTLILGENALNGNEILKCSRGDFNQLEFLRLEKLEDLQRWIVEEGSLLRLRRLEIVECNSLNTIVDALRVIPSLKEILIRDMPQQFRTELEASFPHLTFLA